MKINLYFCRQENNLLLRDIRGMIDSKILEFLSFSSENFYNCLVSKKILL